MSRLDFDCGGDRIYIQDGEGWKLGKITSLNQCLNDMYIISIVNLKKENKKLYLDNRLTFYIFYDKLNDDFFSSKICDLQNEDYWLMYVLPGR